MSPHQSSLSRPSRHCNAGPKVVRVPRFEPLSLGSRRAASSPDRSDCSHFASSRTVQSPAGYFMPIRLGIM
jgi:hypothetical protein